MVEKTIKVELKSGLQARTAAQFVQEANRFSSDLFLEKDGKRVNAKSIMGLMSLSITQGETVTLIAEGADEEIALSALITFISKKEA
ncbi:MAG TPA: HPr family phosphocarrier protein [Pseudogracilibacillus sp.]|nr:HPr family phosphocarrier protein [Pseudogracilibacillus sp.]